MRFYFPDSQDQIDPKFDMLREEHAVHRVRQRDDRYAHEVLRQRPFDGLLVSKAIVDGQGGKGAGRYTAAARHRLYREGVRRFFRLTGDHADVVTMGDCGAFSYFAEFEPPYHVDEVIDFYDGCGFDEGVAPDHIVFGFVRAGEPAPADKVPEWERRRAVTLAKAQEFLARHAARGCSFTPVGVAHGWNAETYAQSVIDLQESGYRRIAMGGMVPLKTVDVLATLEVVTDVVKPETSLHLFGITRTDSMQRFQELGAASFDSTAPFRQAFKDDRDNYYAGSGSYVAIRVPQVDGNATLKRRISSGVLGQRVAIEAERACLRSLREFDAGQVPLATVMTALRLYGELVGTAEKYYAEYERTLCDAPWRSCPCGICERAGIDIVLFRGSERNKRRGFHNLAVFRDRLTKIGFEPTRRRRGEGGE